MDIVPSSNPRAIILSVEENTAAVMAAFFSVANPHYTWDLIQYISGLWEKHALLKIRYHFGKEMQLNSDLFIIHLFIYENSKRSAEFCKHKAFIQ